MRISLYASRNHWQKLVFKDSLCTDESFNSEEERANIFSVLHEHKYLTGVLAQVERYRHSAHTVKVFWALLSYLELRAQRRELEDHWPLRAKQKS